MLTAAKTGTGASLVDAYAYQYDASGNRTLEQINSSVTTSGYNDLNQMTNRSGGGQLAVSGSLSQPGIVTVGSAPPYVTGSGTTFSATVPVVTGDNSIQVSATNANGYGATHTLVVNVTSGTPISALISDSNGNLTYDGTMNYVWDSANRLVKIWYGPISSSSSTTMSYDGVGRRVQILESGSSGAVTSTKNLIWDGMNICEEKNASGTITKSYFPQGVRLGGSNYYYTRDHLGSVRELTDASATVQARYDYDPYGRQTQVSGTMNADFGFTGLYVHQPSGLNLALYREYSASLGRWTSRDPIGDPNLNVLSKDGNLISLSGWPDEPAEIRAGSNLYEYVNNDPIRKLDSWGLYGAFADFFSCMTPCKHIYWCVVAGFSFNHSDPRNWSYMYAVAARMMNTGCRRCDNKIFTTGCQNMMYAYKEYW